MSGASLAVIILIACAVYAVMTYNALVTLRNRVREAWSDVEVQMKRRYNLIPNLVETVKGYAQHESETLEDVIKARNIAMEVDADNVKEASKNESILSGALKSLFAVSENYPDLKANANFMELQRELRDTEDKIQAARRFYNGNVLAYNNKAELFPSNAVASTFNFEKAAFFELDEQDKDARDPVRVSFKK